MAQPPRAIIIGATSGIGEALARELARRGYVVGLTGRRTALLETLQRELGAAAHIKPLDVQQQEAAVAALGELIGELGGLDLLVLNAGVGYLDGELTWEHDRETIAVNVAGFVVLALAGWRYFRERGAGHLVGISSIAGLRGGRGAPAYNASKAFVSNYLAGLQHRLRHDGLAGRIFVTDIRPGFVDTAMVRGNKRMFWCAPAAKAALQIADAIAARKRIAYITHRWRLIAWLMKIMPAALYERI